MAPRPLLLGPLLLLCLGLLAPTIMGSEAEGASQKRQQQTTSNNLFYRTTLSQQQQQQEQQDRGRAWEERERRRVRRLPSSSSSSEGGGGGNAADIMSKLESMSQWASPSHIKLLSDATDDYWGTLMPSMFSRLSASDASLAFEEFKYLETMPVYKDFLASGSKDKEQEGKAKLWALQDLLLSMHDLNKVITTEGGGGGGTGQAVQNIITKGGKSAGRDLQGAMEGDLKAYQRLEQAFANEYMAGVDVSSLHDNTWLDGKRDALRRQEDDGHKMIHRLVGGAGEGHDEDGSGIMSLLLSDDVRLLDPTTAATNDGMDAVRRLHAAMMMTTTTTSPPA